MAISINENSRVMTHKAATAKYFYDLCINDTPLLDVRAEDEYAKGSFPRSTSLPILKYEERRLVGTCYKQHGQQTAIKLRHRLICGEI